MKKIFFILFAVFTLFSCKNTITGNIVDGEGKLHFVTEYNNGNYFDKVAISDEYILANDSGDGLSLFYEPNSSSISFLHKLYADAESVFFFENRFVVYYSGALHYYEINSSNDSEYITSYPIGSIKKVEKYGNDFFLLGTNGDISRIRLYDEEFTLISEYPMSDAAVDMVLIYPVLAVVDDFFINIFDISNSDFLNLEHTTAFIGAKAIDGYNDNLFIASDIGIKHFTLNDDQVLQEVKTKVIGNNYTKIIVEYPEIYCANGSGGIDLLTITSGSIDFVETYDSSGIVEDIAVKGSYVYMATGYNGIVKLKYNYY